LKLTEVMTPRLMERVDQRTNTHWCNFRDLFTFNTVSAESRHIITQWTLYQLTSTGFMSTHKSLISVMQQIYDNTYSIGAGQVVISISALYYAVVGLNVIDLLNVIANWKGLDILVCLQDLIEHEIAKRLASIKNPSECAHIISVITRLLPKTRNTVGHSILIHCYYQCQMNLVLIQLHMAVPRGSFQGGIEYQQGLKRWNQRDYIV
jgi:hypothetical protein